MVEKDSNELKKETIAEINQVIYALERGWQVLKPIGKQLSYNLVFDVGKELRKFPEDIGENHINLVNQDDCNNKRNCNIKGEIAEQKAIIYALNIGWGVLKPYTKPFGVSSRNKSNAQPIVNEKKEDLEAPLSFRYDIVFDIEGYLIKAQVKSATYYKEKKRYYYKVHTQCGSNKNRIKYKPGDFDFAMIYLDEHNSFYFMEFDIFVAYSSSIELTPSNWINGGEEIAIDGNFFKETKCRSNPKKEKYEGRNFKHIYKNNFVCRISEDRWEKLKTMFFLNGNRLSEAEELDQKWYSILRSVLKIKKIF